MMPSSTSTLADRICSPLKSSIACFVLKPVEILFCLEALHQLGDRFSDAVWFVPDEERPAISATIARLEEMGVNIYRYPEARVRVEQLRALRESLGVLRARAFALRHRLRARLCRAQFGVAIGSHNATNWVIASALSADTWILVDSSRLSGVAGYISAMERAGIAGVLEVSARRGKGLGSRHRDRIAESTPDCVIFFSAFAAENSEPSVVRNGMDRLSKCLAALEIRQGSLILVGQKGLTPVEFRSAIAEFPGVSEVIIKPHPRDQNAGAAALLHEAASAAGLRAQIVSPHVAIEELPIVLGYLPEFVVGTQHSTGLDLLALASRGRIAAHLVEPYE